MTCRRLTSHKELWEGKTEGPIRGSIQVSLSGSVSGGGWYCTRLMRMYELGFNSGRLEEGLRGQGSPVAWQKGPEPHTKSHVPGSGGLGGGDLLPSARAWPLTMTDQHLHIPTHWHLSLSGRESTTESSSKWRGLVVDICRYVTACCCAEQCLLSSTQQIGWFRLPSICSSLQPFIESHWKT